MDTAVRAQHMTTIQTRNVVHTEEYQSLRNQLTKMSG